MIALQEMANGPCNTNTLKAHYVTAAWYGSHSSQWTGYGGADVTGKVKDILGAGQAVRADNNLFGDTCPNVPKWLYIKIAGFTQLDVFENTQVQIQSGKMTSAHYGTEQKCIDVTKLALEAE